MSPPANPDDVSRENHRHKHCSLTSGHPATLLLSQRTIVHCSWPYLISVEPGPACASHEGQQSAMATRATTFTFCRWTKEEDEVITKLPLVRNISAFLRFNSDWFVQVALDSCRRALCSSVNVFHVTCFLYIVKY